MKVFVTGGAGFIGTYLVQALQERDWQITIYDRVDGDNLLNYENLRKKLASHDFVWHLAANADTRTNHFYEDMIATYNLLKAMKALGISKIAYTSSATVYGDLAEVVADESVMAFPISPYGASKAACEVMINAYCHMYDLQVWIYRLGNIVGKGITMGVVHDLVSRLKENPNYLEILGDGMQERSFLWIQDCIQGLLAEKLQGTYNLSNTDTLTVSRLVQIVMEEMGVCPYKIEYAGGKRGWRGDAPVVYLDTSKIQVTGWKPSCSSEEAVRRTTRELL